MSFTLEILHVTDQEASSSAIADAPNLSAVLNALQAEDLGDDGLEDNTLVLSSGDAIIPGIFFDSSEGAFGAQGIADIQIQNELGFDAIALGNHEFDLGNEFLASIISGTAGEDNEEGPLGDFSVLTGSTLEGLDFEGAQFPYLSANLDFSTDSDLAPLEVAGGGAPQANSVTSSVVLEENGELIGVVGAVTPTLRGISSPGEDIGIFPEDFDETDPDDLDALAAIIQAEVDQLLAANPDMNKVILLSHMQRITVEQELAARLTDVDVIVAGGSNTRLVDENDRLREGDTAQGTYPIIIENAGGTDTMVVNTDGSYKYVGRLVIDFDEDGNILSDSYDAEVSGAFATDDQGVIDAAARVGEDPDSLIDPEIQDIVDAIEAQIIATESNVFGISNVFLNGNRSGTFAPDDPDGVRTQETNLGNLTADANLAYANQMIEANDLGEQVVVSIKNGGGIRQNIGEIVVPAGSTEAVRTPNQEIVDSEGNVVKPEGGISQNDISATLAFNNGLTLLDITRADLVATLENNVSGLPEVSGGFPQISGIEFSFDQNREAGDRIISASIVDPETGDEIDDLVIAGELVGNPDETVRIVTLNFLANSGDEILSNIDQSTRVDLIDLDGDGVDDENFTGTATFAEDGSEQDALAEFLAANFPDADNAFGDADVGPDTDERIQQLLFRADSIFGSGGSYESGTDEAEELSVDSEEGGTLLGEGGDDTLIGSDNDDVFNSGLGADLIILGDGEDSIITTAAGHDGDIIRGAGLDDVFGVTDAEFDSSALTITEGSAIIQIDADGDGTTDATLTIEGDFFDEDGNLSIGDFMAVGINGATAITFETFLPELADKQELDADLVNGINNEEFLIGNGQDFKFTIEDIGFASRSNSLGVYEVTESGEIVDVQILFADAKASIGEMAVVSDVEDGNFLGVFVVQDGADVFGDEIGDLLFVDENGDPANANTAQSLTLINDETAVDAAIFHAGDSSFNPFGLEHFVSGVAEGGESINFGMEDLVGGGDKDYEDIVFTIEHIDAA